MGVDRRKWSVRAGKSIQAEGATSVKVLGWKEVKPVGQGERGRHIPASCVQGVWLRSRQPASLVHV